jgi:hypothetical protein
VSESQVWMCWDGRAGNFTPDGVSLFSSQEYAKQCFLHPAELGDIPVEWRPVGHKADQGLFILGADSGFRMRPVPVESPPALAKELNRDA